MSIADLKAAFLANLAQKKAASSPSPTAKPAIYTTGNPIADILWAAAAKRRGGTPPTTDGPYFPEPPKQTTIPKTRPRTTAPARSSTATPADGVIPLLFGGPRKIPGLFVYMKVISGLLHVIYLFGKGEMEGVHQVGGVNQIFINDALYTSYAGAVSLEIYKGTQTQNVCSLSSYDSNWTYDLRGFAYIYARFTRTDKLWSLPKFDAIWKGLKLYDHRTGQTAYSSNPILAWAYLMTNAEDGGRVNSSLIDWTSVDAEANYCDQIVSGSEKRFEFCYYFDEEDTLRDVLMTVKRHCLATDNFDNGKFTIRVAKAEASSITYTDKEVRNIKIHEIPSLDMINTVRWTWHDTASYEDVEADPLTDPGLGSYDEIHERVFDFTGCATYSQSKRLGLFHINSRLSDLIVSFWTYNGKGLQPGDRFTLTHSIGLSAKELIAIAIEPNPDGSYSITAREYDPLFFSDQVETTPTWGDTNLPNPADPPPTPINLSVSVVPPRNLFISWKPGDEFYSLAGYMVWLEQPPSKAAHNAYFDDIGTYADGSTGVYVAYINFAWEQSAIAVCGTRQFCPTTTVVRKDMAKLIIKLINETPSTANYDAYFDDIADDEFAPYINRLWEIGASPTCGTRLFCPNGTITRKLVAKTVVLAVGESPSTASYDSYFSDLDVGDSAYNPYINRLYEIGVTNDWAEDTFSPGSNVLRREIAIMIVRAVYRSQHQNSVNSTTLSVSLPISDFARRVSIRVYTISTWGVKSEKALATNFYIPPPTSATEVAATEGVYKTPAGWVLSRVNVDITPANDWTVGGHDIYVSEDDGVTYTYVGFTKESHYKISGVNALDE
jgi:hypothetical protein